MNRHVTGSMAVIVVLVVFVALGLGWGARPRGERKSEAPVKGKTAAAQPVQPSEGPGSSSYPHRGVTKKQIGDGGSGYWLFTPADPVPSEAPVVLFLHGWRALNPKDYGGWIDHMARKGSIVIYPIFEETRTDEPLDMMKRAIQTTKVALDALRKGPIRPRLDRFFIVGHSLGGGLTAQVAARAEKEGLPVPKAIMPTEPGWRGKGEYPADALKDVPSSVLALVVVGSDDQFAETRQAKPIFQGMPQVPADRKRYVMLYSDDHGTPPLIGDHAAPLSPRDDYGPAFTAQQQRRRAMVEMFTGMRDGEVDALDYYGFWRLSDALCEAAFSGRTIDAVVGSPDRLAMGKWSDGTPVKPMTETSTP
jgi:pimeloyl-ACP methyl ester carboxylesterase